ncbi:MAG TPA: tyrosine-type recombinase/integrase [Vicinamibacterales bacterium]|jgi:integrase|nr:tyrosine-type recombinase/integrase [Vicinamibacterales bacterium]
MKGIRRTSSGWQVFARVYGEFRSKHFPPDTPLTTLKRRREELRARAILREPEPHEGPTFGEDCEIYLQAVAGMPTFSDRAYRIGQWRDALGARRARASITSVEIRQQLELWRTAKPKGLAHGSLNLRRTALMHLWTVLDGRSVPNPVRDVPRYDETPEPLRLPSLAQAQRAVAAVGSHLTHCATRARLRVLLWTGWPAAQLMRLTSVDIDWTHDTATLTARRKGKGTRVRTLPLLPEAVDALRELQDAEAWGPFSTSSMHSALARACKTAGVPTFHPYALRHLFLTRLALASRDDRVVAELGMHADIRQARRYTEQSVDPRIRAALEAVQRL